MPASFLHGVETFEFNTGPQPIIVVKSAVIGLVGSAPLFASASPLTIAGATVTGPLLVWDPSWMIAAGQYAIDANGNIQKLTNVVLNSWAATTAFASSALIVDSNGNTQRATTAGTTGGSAPTWPAVLGATVTDGTVTWTLVALGKAGVTNVTAPTWSTALNGATSDGAAVTGTLTWTLVALGPIPNLQTATLINSGGSSGGANQSAVFGPLIQGYTIPYALSEIFGQGAGQVIVVNVFDQTRHFTAVAAAAFTFPASGNQVINLGHMGVSAVKVTNSGATVTYVEGSDFTVDHINGLITAVGGGLFGAGATVKVSFNYADPSKVADADLIGAITNGVYTGMQAWKLSYATLGFFPKILIAPEFGAGAHYNRGFDAGGGAGRLAARDASRHADFEPRCDRQRMEHQFRKDNPVRTAGEVLRYWNHAGGNHDFAVGNRRAEPRQRQPRRAVFAVGGGRDGGKGPGEGLLVVALEYSVDRAARPRRECLRIDSGFRRGREQSQCSGNRDGVQRIRDGAQSMGKPERGLSGCHDTGPVYQRAAHDGRNRRVGDA